MKIMLKIDRSALLTGELFALEEKGEIYRYLGNFVCARTDYFIYETKDDREPKIKKCSEVIKVWF